MRDEDKYGETKIQKPSKEFEKNKKNVKFSIICLFILK